MMWTTDQERGTGPGEGGTSIEESSGAQDVELSTANIHDLLLEWYLPRIQLNDLREREEELIKTILLMSSVLYISRKCHVYTCIIIIIIIWRHVHIFDIPSFH